MNYRNDIEILRGIAVLLVLLFHLNINIFNSGFLGVDVFFVISGFLMSVLYDKNKKIEFYKKRALRLLPVYYAVIILVLIISIVLVTPNEYIQVFKQSIYADFFVSNIGFWMQNSYFSKSEFNPLLHLWSLSVEIQFYILIPLIFYIINIRGVVFWLILICSLIACFLLVGISPKTCFFMMPLRLWEFLIGYGVAKYITKDGAVIHNKTFIGNISFFIILSIPIFNVNGETLSFIYGHPGIYALFITLATAGVLTYGISNVIETSVFGRIFSVLGKYSYSIYMVHFPVIVLFLYSPFSGTSLQINAHYDLVFVVSIIFVLSYITYHQIEERFRTLENIKILLIAPPFIILILTYIGIVVQKEIYTREELLISQAFQDRDTYRCGKIFRIINPKEIICKLTSFSDKPTQKILFVGDSHADSIKHELSNVANDLTTEVYFLVPNDPMSNTSKITPEILMKEAKRKSIDNILLHYSPGSIDIKKVQKIIEMSEENNIFVSLIMPLPTYREHIPKALWRNINYGEPLPELKGSEYDAMHINFKNSLSKINSENFKLYSVKQYFCKEYCEFINNLGEPLYFDNGHLTLSGSRRLSHLFKVIVSDGLISYLKKAKSH